MDKARKENFPTVLVFWVVAFSCICSIQIFFLALCNDSTESIEIDDSTGYVNTKTFRQDMNTSIYSRYFFVIVLTKFVFGKQNKKCIRELETILIHNCSDTCNNKCISICKDDLQEISFLYFSNDSQHRVDQCESEEGSIQTCSNVTTTPITISSLGSSSTTLSTSNLSNPTSESQTNTLNSIVSTTVLSDNLTDVTGISSKPNTTDNNETINIIIGCCVGGGVVILVLLIILLVVLRKKVCMRNTNKPSDSTKKRDFLEISEFRRGKFDSRHGNVKQIISDDSHNDTYSSANVNADARTHKSNVDIKKA